MPAWREAIKRSFWFPSAVAVALGLVLGYWVPEVDEALDLKLGFVGFTDLDSVRSTLQTVATTTISVAGLSFSVTLVALTLASQILSPRVLRTFRGDRIAQGTLAGFIGTFVYSLVVLGRIENGEAGSVPEISPLVAILLAIAAFIAFVAFIGDIVVSLQPSTVIRRIAADGHSAVANRHPRDIGRDPDDLDEAERRAEERMRRHRRAEAHSPRAGFLVQMRPDDLMEVASRHDAFIVQRTMVGDFVVTGQLIAEVWGEDPEPVVEELIDEAVVIGDQRTLAQDVGFPIRQLADVALRGLSPSLNDPTTAETAMGSLANTLVRFARGEQLASLRVDDAGEPRFRARSPSLDDLVRLGFEQVRIMLEGNPNPVVAAQLVDLLGEVRHAARECGLEHAQVDRQIRLLGAIARQLPA